MDGICCGTLAGAPGSPSGSASRLDRPVCPGCDRCIGMTVIITPQERIMARSHCLGLGTVIIFYALYVEQLSEDNSVAGGAPQHPAAAGEVDSGPLKINIWAEL